MRVLAELLGHALQQLQLDLERVLAGSETGAVADTEDVRVDGDGRLAERHVHDNVRRLAADADAVYTPQWKAYIAERYGAPPDIRYFETSVVVDNESDKIDEAA